MLQSPSIASVMARFDRKERNLLVRAVTSNGLPPAICDKFLDDLNTKLALSELVERDSWWSIDFHLDWLAGALAFYVDTSTMVGQARKNQVISEGNLSSVPLVTGSQEDIDLIIATRTNVILVEAKGSGSWDDKQLDRKCVRLNRIHEEYLRIATETGAPLLRFHLVLASIHEPVRLIRSASRWADDNGKLPWIRLPNSNDKPLFVSRCDSEAKVKVSKDFWCVIDRNQLNMAKIAKRSDTQIDELIG